MPTNKPAICKSLPILLLVSLSQVRAATTVSNLTNADNPAPYLIINGGGAATSFTTGPLAATLTSVTTRIANDDPRGATFYARIWSSTDAHPGTPLETTAGIFSDAHNAVLTFPSAGLALTPDTTYWVELYADGPGVARWYYTRIPDQTSAYGWTIGDGTFGTVPNYGPVLVDSPPNIARFSIDATILPEPASLLTACGLALPLLTRPRRSPRREV